MFSALWPTSDILQPVPEGPKPIKKVFEEQVLELSLLCDKRCDVEREGEEYFNACIRAIDQEVNGFCFGFSKEVVEQLSIYRHCLEEVIDHDSDFDEAEVRDIKSLFQHHYDQFFTKKWANGAARDFYQMLLFSEIKEKAQQAQLWASHFFEGVGYFAKRPEFFEQMSSNHRDLCSLKKMIDWIDELEKQVLIALETYIAQVDQSYLKASDQNLEGLTVPRLQISEIKELLQECIAKGFLLLFQEGQIRENFRAKQTFLGCFTSGNDLLLAKENSMEGIGKDIAAEVVFELLWRISDKGQALQRA
jgi:hypothetical protein